MSIDFACTCCKNHQSAGSTVQERKFTVKTIEVTSDINVVNLLQTTVYRDGYVL